LVDGCLGFGIWGVGYVTANADGAGFKEGLSKADGAHFKKLEDDRFNVHNSMQQE